MNATSSLFVNMATGDLHSRSTAAVAIDQGVPVPNADVDWDGETRPSGAGYDIGADERGAMSAAPSKQQQPVSIVYTGRRSRSEPNCGNRPVER